MNTICPLDVSRRDWRPVAEKALVEQIDEPSLRIETWGTRLNCATNVFTATGY
jgi:hypothetical protein